MAKLSAYNRTEVISFTKEDAVTPYDQVSWRRTTLRLMSDGQILIKSDVEFKASQYSPKYKHSYGWKKWAKMKNGPDVEIFRKIAAKRGFN